MILIHIDSSLLFLHRQVRTAISARCRLCACPFHFVGANRRAAVRAIAGQQVGAMDLRHRRGCGSSHRHGRGHRVNGRRRRILIPSPRAGAEHRFQQNAQPHQDQNAGPPMSPEKKDRQADHPERTAERSPRAGYRRTAISVSSIPAHDISFINI